MEPAAATDPPAPATDPPAPTKPEKKKRKRASKDGASESTATVPAAADAVVPEPVAAAPEKDADGLDVTDAVPVDAVAPAPEVAQTEPVAAGGKAKRARKTAPKVKSDTQPRPQNAYMLFYMEEIKKDEYMGIKLPDRARAIGTIWREMDDAARLPFKERAKAAKEATVP